MLADFLTFTLDGHRPALSEGTLASGVRWKWHDDGILSFERPGAATHSVVASAGIHGDETAPIELLAALVADIASGAAVVGCRLLVILGNIGAMRAAHRYLDDDLNRIFNGRHAALAATSHEAPRAAAIEAATLAFFVDQPHPRWHIDMHTAIRASVFEQFALLPHTGAPLSRAMFEWLQDAGLGAVLLHREKSNTFSHFTAEQASALACTLELGKVRPFGQNDLMRFAAADRALRRLVAGDAAIAAANAEPFRVFTVVGQIDKKTDGFELDVASDVPNFTPFAPGTVLARDVDYAYRVGDEEERIVFPNPRVKPGLRAGLMVVDTTEETRRSLV